MFTRTHTSHLIAEILWQLHYYYCKSAQQRASANSHTERGTESESAHLIALILLLQYCEVAKRAHIHPPGLAM